MRRSLIILTLLTVTHCTRYEVYDHCKVLEYYKYDGVEYTKCYE